MPQDEPTIQAGVDAADLGDVVLVSSGTYDETVRLIDVHGVTIRAKGKVTLAPDITGGPVLDVVRCTDLWIDGLRFVLGDETPGIGGPIGIYLEQCTGVLVQDCDMVAVTRGVDAAISQGVAVVRSSFRKARAAVVLDASERCVVAENTMRDVSRGVYCIGATACSVTENDIAGDLFAGVDISGGAGVLALDNKVRDAGFGLRVVSDGAHQLLRNDVKDASVGLELRGAGEHMAVGNRVNRASGVGLRVASPDAVVQGNSVKKSGEDGMRIDTVGVLVVANAVSRSAATGVQVTSGDNAVAFNSVNKSGEVDLSGSADNVFLANKAKTVD